MSQQTGAAARWSSPSERALERAERHLERLGYRVLANRSGDRVVIARSWPLAVACHVTALGPDVAGPADPDTTRRELRTATSRWLSETTSRGFLRVRFDRIHVLLSASGEPVGLDHQPNAL